MKPTLLLTLLTALALSACQNAPRRPDQAPVVGAATGVHSQSVHSGNSDGSRTDLR
jgi:hypothetical protein